MEARQWPKGEKLSTKTLIVGGGIAGLSAAWQLKGQDFLLCELSDRLGGSSGSATFGKEKFCQGAHYDLPYPDYFGERVPQFFESLGIMQFNTLNHNWEFTDQQFMIAPEDESRSLVRSVFRDSVLPTDKGLPMFLEKLRPFSGKLKLPTPEIPKSLHHFNKISFYDWLRDEVRPHPKLLEGMDYHMMDDFGGTCAEVSALAGLYYYGSRAFFNEDAEIFSPPEGNFYFVEKIAQQLPPEQLKTQHLISRISPEKQGFSIQALDLQTQQQLHIHADRVVYAGHKHALKFVMPEVASTFSHNRYVPWMVLNFVAKADTKLPVGYWQSEMVGMERAFLGFVDSDAQHTAKQHRVLTAYYCFKPGEREMMVELEKDPRGVAIKTLGYLARFFNIRYSDLAEGIAHCFIKTMGHAMPLPAPNFLLNNANEGRTFPNLTFAGVDNGRLPLLFEAADSGLTAVDAFTGSA